MRRTQRFYWLSLVIFLVSVFNWPPLVATAIKSKSVEELNVFCLSGTPSHEAIASSSRNIVPWPLQQSTHGHEATNGAWPSGPGVKEDEEGKLRRLSLRNTQRFNKEQVTPSWEIVMMLDRKKFDRHKNRTNFLPAVILTFLSLSSLWLSWLSV